MGKLNQTFTTVEQDIKNMFPNGSKFNYKGDSYEVMICDKPRPSKGSGECKTDVYLKAKNTKGDEKEWKISIKKNNADFLENKIKLERAIEIFGPEAQAIIKKSIESIKDRFENTPLVYCINYRGTEALSITLGWKFEFVNKPGGDKSGLICLTDDQKIDVFAGTNLSDEKKNSIVDGKTIKDSGVANYFLEIEDVSGLDAEAIIGKLVDIENYAKQQNIYFACKALNYRLTHDKWDGDRPLSVYVDWTIKDGKLFGERKYDSPLSKKGNEIGETVRSLLKELKVSTAPVLANVTHKDVKVIK